MVPLDVDIARWDALLSQSPAASHLLRDAFGYQGPVLETGYHPTPSTTPMPPTGRTWRRWPAGSGQAS